MSRDDDRDLFLAHYTPSTEDERRRVEAARNERRGADYWRRWAYREVDNNAPMGGIRDER